MKIGKREGKVLRLISLGLLNYKDLYGPSRILTDSLNKYFDGKREKERIKRNLKRLEEKGVIFLGGEKIILSKTGKQLLERLDSVDINLSKGSWDGLWRVVAYDIPNEFKKERDYFREKLQGFGFVNVQKSLWAFPFECREEIALIAQNLKIAPFIIILTTEKLPNEKNIRALFDLG